jgi:diguanylate cyclase (GGDEF)-like protein
MKRSHAPLATLVALGAPFGLAVAERVTKGGPVSPRWLAEQIAHSPFSYLFVGIYSLLTLCTFARELDKKQRLLESAYSDELTGLASRRLFATRLKDEVRRAERDTSSLSLLLIDVDHLKDINDTGGGHEAGDAALRAVAESVRDACRATDLAARFGGDEFAVVAPGADTDRAMELATRIRQKLASHLARGSRGRPLTVSIGIADLSETIDRTAEELCDAADRALYVAKSSGRDRAQCSSSTPPRTAELTPNL